MISFLFSFFLFFLLDMGWCFSFGIEWIMKEFTTSMALRVVSSLEAAMQPSSGDPPSHMPTKAATERAAWMYTIRSPSRTPGALGGGTQRGSSQSSHFSGRLSAASCARSSGNRAYIIIIIIIKRMWSISTQHNICKYYNNNNNNNNNKNNKNKRRRRRRRSL